MGWRHGGTLLAAQRTEGRGTQLHAPWRPGHRTTAGHSPCSHARTRVHVGGADSAVGQLSGHHPLQPRVARGVEVGVPRWQRRAPLLQLRVAPLGALPHRPHDLQQLGSRVLQLAGPGDKSAGLQERHLWRRAAGVVAGPPRAAAAARVPPASGSAGRQGAAKLRPGCGGSAERPGGTPHSSQAQPLHAAHDGQHHAQCAGSLGARASHACMWRRRHGGACLRRSHSLGDGRQQDSRCGGHAVMPHVYPRGQGREQWHASSSAAANVCHSPGTPAGRAHSRFSHS